MRSQVRILSSACSASSTGEGSRAATAPKASSEYDSSRLRRFGRVALDIAPVATRYTQRSKEARPASWRNVRSRARIASQPRVYAPR
jgi:hypothetical protein